MTSSSIKKPPKKKPSYNTPKPPLTIQTKIPQSNLRDNMLTEPKKTAINCKVKKPKSKTVRGTHLTPKNKFVAFFRLFGYIYSTLFLCQDFQIFFANTFNVLFAKIGVKSAQSVRQAFNLLVLGLNVGE